jgi:hypothetical protein
MQIFMNKVMADARYRIIRGGEEKPQPISSRGGRWGKGTQGVTSPVVAGLGFSCGEWPQPVWTP